MEGNEGFRPTARPQDFFTMERMEELEVSHPLDDPPKEPSKASFLHSKKPIGRAFMSFIPSW
jgi:hypothetical protein